jgi:hypothetical protein
VRAIGGKLLNQLDEEAALTIVLQTLKLAHSFASTAGAILPATKCGCAILDKLLLSHHVPALRERIANSGPGHSCHHACGSAAGEK